jgi:hypothetical protein
VEGIWQKLIQVDQDIARIATAAPPKLSEKIHELIKRQFAFAADEDSRALEGAIALAKFGQFEKALVEFELLMDRPSLRVDAAKNIIRCHLALKDINKAVALYEQWLSTGHFTAEDQIRLKLFLETMLKNEGIRRDLPDGPAAAEGTAVPAMPAAEAAGAAKTPVMDLPTASATEEDMLEISAISLEVEENRRIKTVELNINFQARNVISILIPGRDKLLQNLFKKGAVVKNIQFYSAIAIFNGDAEVMSNTRIESGPRRGDFSIDLKVLLI